MVNGPISPPPPGSSPNAAAYAALQKHYQSQLSKIVEGMNLRKWLVEKTIEAGRMPPTSTSIEDLERLHAFIIEPSTNGLTPPESQESQP